MLSYRARKILLLAVGDYIATGEPVASRGLAERHGVDLSPASFAEVTDQALRTMLERLSDESRMGNYGIYFGNQTAGRIALVTQGPEATGPVTEGTAP